MSQRVVGHEGLCELCNARASNAVAAEIELHREEPDAGEGGYLSGTTTKGHHMLRPLLVSCTVPREADRGQPAVESKSLRNLPYAFVVQAFVAEIKLCVGHHMVEGTN